MLWSRNIYSWCSVFHFQWVILVYYKRVLFPISESRVLNSNHSESFKRRKETIDLFCYNFMVGFGHRHGKDISRISILLCLLTFLPYLYGQGIVPVFPMCQKAWFYKQKTQILLAGKLKVLLLTCLRENPG